jgi:hypothetical protein
MPMETTIYSDYEPGESKRVKKSVRVAAGEGGAAEGSSSKGNEGAFGFELGETVKVLVDTRQPRNPRMIYCTLSAPDGVEHRILVKVGRKGNFRPRMELEVRVPAADQQSEPWPYSGRMPRHRGLWGTPGPRGRAV